VCWHESSHSTGMGPRDLLGTPVTDDFFFYIPGPQNTVLPKRGPIRGIPHQVCGAKTDAQGHFLNWDSGSDTRGGWAAGPPGGAAGGARLVQRSGGGRGLRGPRLTGAADPRRRLARRVRSNNSGTCRYG